jgi:hypothetical protein
MSFRYLQNIENEPEYYIEKCFDNVALMRLHKELEEAEKLIASFKKRIFDQYQQNTQVVNYIVIESARYQSNYSSDKKVYINISASTVKQFEGKKVKQELIYGTCKKFAYSEMNQSIDYIKSLLLKYAGSTYKNGTSYNKLNI